MDSTLYTLEKIKHGYNNKFILDIPGLDIKKGTAIGFIGANGSGKSTLFRILALLDRPASGTIYYKGRRAWPDGSEDRNEIIMLLQDPYLLKRTVFGNVAYGLKIRKFSGDIKNRVGEALECVGLSPEVFGQRQWHELSGGEAQRVALASRLILNPEVLILDEPTSNIDVESAAQVKKAIEQIRERYNSTLIISSHDHIWLNQVADEILRMHEGKVIGSGIENIIEGSWRPYEDGLWVRELSHGERIYSTKPPDSGSVALLSPSEIILSESRPEGISAQNCLAGVITSLTGSKEFGKIRIDVDIHGLRLVCDLTQHAVSALSLLPGKNVWVVFKASSLHWQ